ncbi:MAG: hypothetical protein A3H17_01325 [Candidatus Levybacteria bacterium RIFCSPLOWO2_12_FULL_37_14]|nr:MAG: hypothetical protein US55_C0043G0006 [Candidatus Levybacteria bacterium GW2011_GWC2_37_7]OGH51017.1 MAG: hypothetical protein A3H17_01325 [Candidatus Levybacteria bacterium RIFCSPLOWO2_12_FULL_37_14]
MDLLKKIFIFVLFLFPLGEIARIDFGNGVALKPLDIGVGVLVSSWLAFKLFNKQKIRQKNIYIPALLFSLSGFFSLTVGNLQLSLNEFLISFLYLLRWLAYAGVFFVISDFDNDFKKKISNTLIIVGSLVVGLGYLQYFFYSNLRNLYYLGWDEHMHRMFSVFLDPNFAGAFFVLFFLFLIGVFLKNKNISAGILLMLTLGAVFLTFSRSALIMLIISSSLLFVLMHKKIWIAILFGITILVITMSSRYFSIENINLFRIVSSEARLATAKEAVRIILSRPIFGVGFNSYRYAKLDYGLRNNKLYLISHADAGVDNSFLFVAATTGIVGFILYLFLWFRIFKIASILAIASIAGIFINSLFINSLFYPFIMLWLWIIIAIKVNR